MRGSFRLAVESSAFDNPIVQPHLILRTSGTTGRPSRVRYALQYFVEQAETIALVLDAHRADRPRLAYWLGAPIHHIFISGMLGSPAAAWFYPVHPLPGVVRLLGAYLRLLGRFDGYPFPAPRRCDLNDPAPLLSWLRRAWRTGEPLALFTTPSAAARLARAAHVSGHDLRGLTFMIAGEPVTQVVRSQIETTGARATVAYGSVELSGPSYSCATPAAPDDLHVMTDRFAVIPRRRVLPDGPEVDALLVTTLSGWAPKIALNAELGDYASIEDRACGCPLGTLGLRTHLSEVRSFEKITGEGVSFARTDLQQILEDTLPARFGGTNLDYQLAEHEAPDGARRIVVRVHPSVGHVDEAALRETILETLSQDGLVETHQAGLWRGAGSIEVQREAPVATQAGKVLPFQVLRHVSSERPH